MGNENKPHCCEISCDKDAEFEIIGEPNGDMIQTCVDHVGTLLGTPSAAPKDNTSWIVKYL